MPELDFRSPRLFVDAPLGAGETVALDRNQSNYELFGTANHVKLLRMVLCGGGSVLRALLLSRP